MENCKSRLCGEAFATRGIADAPEETRALARFTGRFCSERRAGNRVSIGD